MKSLTLRLLAVGLGAAALSMPSQAAPNSLLARALADPARSADRGADARRHPAELVALADLKPGQRILDLIPGDGYWTRIFSRMVGPKGRVYAVWPQALCARGDRQRRPASADCEGLWERHGAGAAWRRADRARSRSTRFGPPTISTTTTTSSWAARVARLCPLGLPDPEARRACSSSSTTPRRPAMVFATPRPCTGSSAPRSSAKRLPPASGWPARARRCSIPATR